MAELGSLRVPLSLPRFPAVEDGELLWGFPQSSFPPRLQGGGRPPAPLTTVCGLSPGLRSSPGSLWLQQDTKYEQACILYNLGEALLPQGPLAPGPAPCSRRHLDPGPILPSRSSACLLLQGAPWWEALLGCLLLELLLCAPAQRWPPSLSDTPYPLEPPGVA